ncbi:hypothetical protein ALT721_2120037 [Alteromonas alvinellae]
MHLIFNLGLNNTSPHSSLPSEWAMTYAYWYQLNLLIKNQETSWH